MSTTSSPSDPGPARPDDRPLSLRIGLAVALLEAVGLVVIGVASVVLALAGDAAFAGFAAGVLVVLLLIGGLLFLAVRALWQGKRWGRGPVITWQLLQFAVGAASYASVPWWAATVPMVLAVVVVVTLLVPASLAATSGAGGPDAVA
ncbi:hypothetical protein EXU48_04580 [Occultella glacieicola]|uniref:Integral membrane protein n=1 Tax=Occultella glacieicola TaxID=2518684 RepID=A0ABY2E9L9_9MICO|nr:hypothetical protein [Occultella glacieicola]TDE97470.1 hypothetical protein EXU48_04580 [Occultella glacieicola]